MLIWALSPLHQLAFFFSIGLFFSSRLSWTSSWKEQKRHRRSKDRKWLVVHALGLAQPIWSHHTAGAVSHRHSWCVSSKRRSGFLVFFHTLFLPSPYLNFWPCHLPLLLDSSTSIFNPLTHKKAHRLGFLAIAICRTDSQGDLESTGVSTCSGVSYSRVVVPGDSFLPQRDCRLA